MAIKMRITGLREIDRQLAELPKATQRNVLVRALTEAAQPLERTARALAPKREHDLAESITTTTQKPPGYEDAGRTAFAGVLAAGGTRAQASAALRAARRANPNSFAEVFVGPGRHPQAITQEFGTWFHPAHPFLRPAWDATRDKVLALLANEIKFQLFTALERRARRAARGN